MTLSSTPSFAGQYLSAVASAGGLQGRVLWCDAEANLWELSSREKVAELADRCKEVNINTIVVDVKPLSGLVLYNSKIAPKIRDWKGKTYPADYDLLKTIVEEGKRVGIDVYAAINVFSEGMAGSGAGPAFSHPDWQCVKYELERSVRGSYADIYPISEVNRAASPGRLALITSEKSMPKDRTADMVRVAVDASGKVTSILTDPNVNNTTIPKDGYMLVGTDAAGVWLKTNALPGGKMTLECRPRLVPVARAADEHLAVFVNPADPEVRAYELSIISEIISNYDVAGIVFDRMRYPGIYADFSSLSRRAFEEWIGEKVERFPEDIMTLDPLPGRPFVQGKHFARWMEWRAKQIKDFVVEARKLVKSIKPDAKVAAYVGSWYDSYFDVGVNWASPDYNPPYEWASPTYKDTGYADLMDWICTGCYYEHVTTGEARGAAVPEWQSVEAAGRQSNETVMDSTFVYGSLYLLQYNNDPARFERAIAACNATTQGVMLFDLVYARNYDWWGVLKRAFASPAKAPHAVPGLREKVREVRQLVEKN